MTEAPDYTVVRLPRDDAGPVFDRPWQAQAFSIVLKLYEAGVFAWSDWVAVFSDEIGARPARVDETANEAYYRQWLSALERIVASSGLLSAADVDARASGGWRISTRPTRDLSRSPMRPARRRTATPMRISQTGSRSPSVRLAWINAVSGTAHVTGHVPYTCIALRRSAAALASCQAGAGACTVQCRGMVLGGACAA
jgi:nitrile hydratase accessory protein